MALKLWNPLKAKPKVEQAVPAADPHIAGEIAPRRRDVYNYGMAYLGRTENDDPLLALKQGSAGYGYQYPYGLYDEAVDTDPHLNACLQQRRSALFGSEWNIVPGDETSKGRITADFIEGVLFRGLGQADGDAGLTKDVSEMLYAVAIGVAIMEKVWARSKVPIRGKSDGRDYLVIARLLARDPRTFIFDADGNLRLLTPEERHDGIATEPWQFLLFRPYSRYENFYGFPQLRVVWWSCWFKKALTAMMMSHAERYGSGILVAQMEEGRSMSQEQINTLNDDMLGLYNASSLVMPEGTKLVWEQLRNTDSNPYETGIRFCNNEISKAILGQTLTVEASNDAGSRSLGEVQERAALNIIAQDARAVEAAVNNGLIRELIDLNFPGYPYPRLEINVEPPKDMATQIAVDQGLFNMGADLDVDDLCGRYGRKRAATDESNIQSIALKYMQQQAEMQMLTDPTQKGDTDTRPGYDKGANPKQQKNPRARSQTSSAGNQAKRAQDRQRNTGR